MYAIIGDWDRAAELLETACARRSGLLSYARVDPGWRPCGPIRVAGLFSNAPGCWANPLRRSTTCCRRQHASQVLTSSTPLPIWLGTGPVVLAPGIDT